MVERQAVAELEARKAAGRVLEPGRVRRRALPWAPRTLDRYACRIFLASYGACAISFTGIYIMIEVVTKLDRFLKLEAPLWTTIPEYHLAMVPTIYVNYLGPILTTAAAVATAVGLHRANELAPVQASGVSLHRFLAPIFALALAFMGLNYWLQEKAIPQLRGPIRRAISLTRSGALRPDPFFDEATAQHIKIREYSPAVQVGRGVEVLRQYPHGRPREKIDAQEIVWEPDPASKGGPDRGSWILHNGSIQRWNEKGDLVRNPNALDFAHLKEPFLKRKLEGSLLPIDLESSDQDISYLSWSELKTQLRRQPSQRHLEVKLHHHLAFPLAHLFLPALAIPLILGSRTRSVLVAVAGSVLLCAAYYLLSSFSLSTAIHSDRFSPLLAAWLPVLFFGALGVTLTANMKT